MFACSLARRSCDGAPVWMWRAPVGQARGEFCWPEPRPLDLHHAAPTAGARIEHQRERVPGRLTPPPPPAPCAQGEPPSVPIGAVQGVAHKLQTWRGRFLWSCWNLGQDPGVVHVWGRCRRGGRWGSACRCKGRLPRWWQVLPLWGFTIHDTARAVYADHGAAERPRQIVSGFGSRCAGVGGWDATLPFAAPLKTSLSTAQLSSGHHTSCRCQRWATAPAGRRTASRPCAASCLHLHLLPLPWPGSSSP